MSHMILSQRRLKERLLALTLWQLVLAGAQVKLD
jgi:hypothetical protein